MKHQSLFFFRKLGKMSQNLSSAAVVIGALRVKHISLQNAVTYYSYNNAVSDFSILYDLVTVAEN